MTGAEQKPRVIVFDDYPDEVYRNLGRKASEKAGWQSLVYGDPHAAIEDFDESIQALITGLGTGGAVLSSHFPADILLHRSEELSVPRAIVSGHPYANRVLLTGDILIQKTDYRHDIIDRLAGWLISLTVDTARV